MLLKTYPRATMTDDSNRLTSPALLYIHPGLSDTGAYLAMGRKGSTEGRGEYVQVEKAQGRVHSSLSDMWTAIN